MVAAVQLVANNGVAGASGGQAGGDEAKGGDGFSALLSAVGGDAAGAEGELAAGLAAQAEALVRDNIADGKDLLLQAVAIAISAPVQLVQDADVTGDAVLDGSKLALDTKMPLTPDMPIDLSGQLSGAVDEGVLLDAATQAASDVALAVDTGSAEVAKDNKNASQAADAASRLMSDVKTQVAAAKPQETVAVQASAVVSSSALQSTGAAIDTGAQVAQVVETEQPAAAAPVAPVKLTATQGPVIQSVAEKPAEAAVVTAQVAQPQAPAVVKDAAASLLADNADAQGAAPVDPQEQGNAKPKTDITPVVVMADIKVPVVKADSASPLQLVVNNAPAVEVLADAGSQAGGQSSGGQQQGASSQAVPLPQMAAPPASGSASSGSPAHFAQHLAQASSVPVLDQVVVHLRNNQHDGSSRIQIQLEPVELGKLEIRLDVAADGKTGVTVTAENRAALETLQRDVRGLERALNDAGLKTDSGSLSFNLRGEQQDHQQQGRKQAQNYSKKSAQEEEELQAIGQIVSRSLSLSVRDGLDIHI